MSVAPFFWPTLQICNEITSLSPYVLCIIDLGFGVDVTINWRSIVPLTFKSANPRTFFHYDKQQSVW